MGRVLSGVEGTSSQPAADYVTGWFTLNRLQLNGDKYDELRMSFAKQKQMLEPTVVNGKDRIMCRECKASWHHNIKRLLME